MRKLLYIFLVLGLICSCERNELDIKQKGDGISSGEATISFSALMPSSPVSTKSMGGDPEEGVNNLYLVVFDENGMLVETRRANLVGEPSKHGNNHASEQQYSVTLTLTEKPRIIHFIANCPVDQIVYGHEASVIGNMYVENGKVAYWARIEVDELIIDTDQAGNPEKDLTEVDKFKCVPMLRNYAQLTITNDESDFEFEGYCIYNVTHRGTIAPYNSYSEPVGFQNFVKEDGTKYNYPELYALPYYGHALTSTQLITTPPTETDLKNNTCSVVVYRWKEGKATPEEVTGYGPIYLYERKISVKQGDEAAWRESPSHLIIKGKFGNDEQSSYYKVDITRKIDGVPQYYNILRNFHYNFTIHDVHSSGYSSIDAAIAGSTSNNLSGSASTSKFDNISDQEGRLWVSYTTKTLVDGGDDVTIDFYYKYVPDLDNDNTTANDTLNTANAYVKFENYLGGKVIDATNDNVTNNFVISEGDETTGQWAGYRKVTMSIKEPKALAEEQIFTVKAINVSNNTAEVLSRNVHLILKTPYQMEVNCTTPKVAANIGEEVVVEILIPDDLTENLFPLDLNIEAEKRSLSPNLEMNTLPVVSGKSIIPEKNNNSSFYYVKTIETYNEYKNKNNENPDDDFEIRQVNGKKYVVIPTYWITNRTDNGSTVYVQNDYFETDCDNFINPLSFNGSFSGTSLGVDAIQTVDYSFDIHEYHQDMTVTVTLSRLEPIASGSGLTATSTPGVYTYKPSAAGRQTIHLQTTETSKGPCSVTLSTDDEYGYMEETNTIQQIDVLTAKINSTVTGTLSNITNGTSGNNQEVTVSITIGSNTTLVDGTVSRTGRFNYTYSYSFSISNWTIEYDDPDPIVNISLTYRNYSYTGTCNLQQLISGDVTGLTLSR